MSDPYYILNEEFSDPKRIKKERDQARKLKKSQWWFLQIQKSLCYYCQKKFLPSQLTLDHIVPLARGGRSRRGNVVPACPPCNQQKKLHTPVDQLLNQISQMTQKTGDEDANR